MKPVHGSLYFRPSEWLMRRHFFVIAGVRVIGHAIDAGAVLAADRARVSLNRVVLSRNQPMGGRQVAELVVRGRASARLANVDFRSSNVTYDFSTSEAPGVFVMGGPAQYTIPPGQQQRARGLAQVPAGVTFLAADDAELTGIQEVRRCCVLCGAVFIHRYGSGARVWCV